MIIANRRRQPLRWRHEARVRAVQVHRLRLPRLVGDDVTRPVAQVQMQPVHVLVQLAAAAPAGASNLHLPQRRRHVRHDHRYVSTVGTTRPIFPHVVLALRHQRRQVEPTIRSAVRLRPARYAPRERQVAPVMIRHRLGDVLVRCHRRRLPRDDVLVSRRVVIDLVQIVVAEAADGVLQQI